MINIKIGIFTRGVLIDFPRLVEVDYLPGGQAIYPDDLDAWEKKAGVKAESGDAFRSARAAGRGSRQKGNGTP